MDSLTHIVLGAATGEAVLGRKVGNKSLLWGALAGSLPDFDVAITSLFDPVQALFVHRGFSHSIIFALLVAPFLGWIASRIHKNTSIKQWTWMMLWAILIHSAIDCFNTYGTALLEPFSNARLAFDSLGIIDIFLLLPITITMVVIISKPQLSTIRKTLSLVILGFTLLYVVFTIGNKINIERQVKQQLAKQDISYVRLKTAPLPLTNFLWLVLAEDSQGYYYAYIGSFDRQPMQLKYIQRNSNELGELSQNNSIQELIRFTEGYYKVDRNSDGSIWIHDLRFGSMAFDSEEEWFVFSFEISGEPDDIIISRSHPNRSFNKKNANRYFARIFRGV